MNAELHHNEAHEALAVEDEAQQVLNELWNEKRLPFRLNVGKITKHGGYYTIHFYDSRIDTATVVLTQRQSFREMVREAVLARVAEMSGPLRPQK